MTPAHVYLDGWRVALVAEPGRKWMKVIALNSRGVRIHSLPRDAERSLRPIPGKASKATPQRIARRWLKAGRVFGISKQARQMLRAIAAAEGGAE